MIETDKPEEGDGSMVENPGPLTRTVLDYAQTIRDLVPKVQTPADLDPVADFLALEEFERVGTFLEVQNWPQYAEMLTQWASVTDSFATTVRRISELPGFVFFEVEEKHFRGDDVTVVNSMTVFEFDSEGKIRHLDVYLQQPMGGE